MDCESLGGFYDKRSPPQGSVYESRRLVADPQIIEALGDYRVSPGTEGAALLIEAILYAIPVSESGHVA